MTDWQPIEGAKFSDDQAVRLRLLDGSEVTAFFRDCEWLREDDPDTLDCFERYFPGSGHDIEVVEVFSWRPATDQEVEETRRDGEEPLPKLQSGDEL